MRLPFYKYQGTGNDFVLIDNRQKVLGTSAEALAKKLCHRKWGIGADGMLLLQNHSDYVFEVLYYNADGSPSFCANGCRCAVHLAEALGLMAEDVHFLAADGPHWAAANQNVVQLSMNAVTGIQKLSAGYWLDTGAPHYVQWGTDFKGLSVADEGKAVRNRPAFQKVGVNVNFVQPAKGNTLVVRTYERGVEAETLSCGTGAVAAALVAATQGYHSPVAINMPGGRLQVSFAKGQEGYFQDIHLTGPVQRVFFGEIALGVFDGVLR